MDEEERFLLKMERWFKESAGRDVYNHRDKLVSLDELLAAEYPEPDYEDLDSLEPSDDWVTGRGWERG